MKFIIDEQLPGSLALFSGNIKNSQLIALFEANYPVLLRELRPHDVVEMGQKTISLIY